MSHPLRVAFLWHQHQPDYRDPFDGAPRLPWARLHAAKDYLHMAELVADFPAIHCTFNFVPSLVEQLDAIANGRYVDAWQRLSLKGSWTRDEKQFLLDHFTIHPRILARYPAYARLRDNASVDAPDQFFIDLAACFNLAWIDPRAMERDDALRALARKSEGFTRDDIAAIIAKQGEIAARVIPFHRDLAARGQIEISLSPYYHPILPLLIDQGAAREALPNIEPPSKPFAHPEDAAEQIQRAVEAHRKYFGGDATGMWPSEGSVSDALIPLVQSVFQWLATDEGILSRSLGTAIERDGDGHVTNPRVLYQPYRQGDLALIFRDHFLSNKISFAYQHLPAQDAARDLVNRLHVIRERLADEEHAYLVPIILDGENAWEAYENNADDFFRALYGLLSNDAALKTVTIGEYLRENPPREEISHLAAGSWINSNFDTWIGEPAHNCAWDLLAQTREALTAWQRAHDTAEEEVMQRAWDELYIAEGSDWFWWYSSRNNSGQDAMFDELFRGHLQNVYAIMGLPLPDELKEPIRKESSGK